MRRRAPLTAILAATALFAASGQAAAQACPIDGYCPARLLSALGELDVPKLGALEPVRPHVMLNPPLRAQTAVSAGRAPSASSLTTLYALLASAVVVGLGILLVARRAILGPHGNDDRAIKPLAATQNSPCEPPTAAATTDLWCDLVRKCDMDPMRAARIIIGELGANPDLQPDSEDVIRRALSRIERPVS